MDAFAWSEEVTGELKAEFGERLRFVGIQECEIVTVPFSHLPLRSIS